jgi:hypothetical protein
LLHDPYAGHRDYDDPFWVGDPVRDTLWTDWDYALAEAISAIDQLTSPTGQPRWLTEDPEVYWDIGSSVDYSVKTLSDEAAKYKDGVPPEVNHFVKNPHKAGEFWTMEEWLEWRESLEDGPPIDRDAPEGARPPLPEELAEMQRAREERLAAKLAEAAEDYSVD